MNWNLYEIKRLAQKLINKFTNQIHDEFEDMNLEWGQLIKKIYNDCIIKNKK